LRWHVAIAERLALQMEYGAWIEALSEPLRDDRSARRYRRSVQSQTGVRFSLSQKGHFRTSLDKAMEDGSKSLKKFLTAVPRGGTVSPLSS
jgi:hypothetical protein